MSEDRINTPQSLWDDRELLRRLSTPDAGAAWAEFVDRYSTLIVAAAGHFDCEPGRVGECYLFVCEKLCADDFKRLQKFNTQGKARFRTWLGAVVFNLCVDWHRKKFGRAIMLPAISALPSFDQEVYRLNVEKGLDRHACFETLLPDFPDLTREQVSEALARIFRALTPRQRWQIAVRLRRRRGSGHANVEWLERPEPGPGSLAERRQESEFLERALTALPGDEQVLLRLRFYQGLTLDRLVQVMDLGDVFRARRRVQSALAALEKQLNKLRVKSLRKN